MPCITTTKNLLFPQYEQLGQIFFEILTFFRNNKTGEKNNKTKKTLNSC